MNKIKVLHLFGAYLNTTENWAYRLINSLNNCKIYVGAPIMLKHNFYSSKFTYISNPLDSLIQHVLQHKRGTFKSLVKSFILKINQIFWGNYTHFLLKASRREHIELIHSHFSFVGYNHLALSKKLRIPHLISFYGFDYEWLPHNYTEWKIKYKTLFQEGDIFICEGNYSASLMNKIGCDQSKIRIVKLGINPEKINFYPRNKRNGELKLLQVASFNFKKGHRYAVEAFASIIKSCPNMTMTFVGKDGLDCLEQPMKELVKELKLEDKVFFHGMIDFENLHEFMSDYQVFIHPSCHSSEKDSEGGAPVVLLDAQATGMPVISTSHCDIPDEVIHGKTGLLSQECNVEELAKSIARFYSMEQAEYNYFSNNAREHVAQNYDVTKNAFVLEDVYREVLQQKKTKTKPAKIISAVNMQEA